MLNIVTMMLLVSLPLAGVWLAGLPLDRYLEFPPHTQYIAHAPFSWPIFAGLGALQVGLIVPLVLTRRGPGPAPRAARAAFPWWGWVGLGLGALAWLAAWTRLPWLAPIQAHTFSPLWLAYIVVVNALIYRRDGSCMLTHRTGHLGRLFVLSAGFWWFFEYLNRFVQNWRYEGIAPMGGAEYFLFATLPFSTVLPAVMSTYEWLAGRRAGWGWDTLPALRLRRPKRWAAAWLAVGLGSLLGLPAWPNLLFPFLWISPLVVLASLQALAGRGTIFRDLESGRWRRLVLLSLAALACGFFWEMWNYFSLARWVYQIPFVNRFHIFEMPLLGYAGYLPFGWECAVMAAWAGSARRDPPD